ncbi:ABC transporter substrate-binding protein [Synechococcus sp. UW179A]|uniref:ABC transporter substrate-binding protein n=1 Tax=Synechococcus sp. UW179A TaxID=2575510 RepID=UPI001483A985|nr:ABC transporter substrate-binding protein [Synechococcus sp. UW179A]
MTILLSSCSSLKAPNTLFISYPVDASSFKDDVPKIQSRIDEYTEAFQSSYPETRLVYITYPSSKFVQQIEADANLNLGPDLIIADTGTANELLKRNLTTILPDKKYFQAIYGSRFPWARNANGKYVYAPWVVDTQIACFNNTKIKESPSTIQELENLSASGRKIGLSSDPLNLIWSAGSKGAMAEISSLGNQVTSKQAFPSIRGWLEWLRKAALYNNIYFYDNPRDLGKNLQNNKLDWCTCWGLQIDDLKRKMGSTLSVAALPNGMKSKASPPISTIVFALGRNSSKSQRKMALKFIKSSVNTISQRKLQLRESGLLAANQNVAIPPQSSKQNNALDTSYNEQNNHYEKDWHGIYRWLFPQEKTSKNSLSRYWQLSRTFREFTNGYLGINEAMKILTMTKEN